jgi:hypothetical protein
MTERIIVFKLSRLIVPVGAVLLLGIGTPVAAEAAASDAGGSFIIHGGGRPSPAMPIEDAQGIAAATGLTEPEVIDAYGEQAAFTVALAAIWKREQGIYFSAGWEPGEGYDAWVGFTEKPSEATIADLRGLAIDVQVRTDAPATEMTLDAVLERLIDGVRATPGVTDASGSWDGHDGRVVIVYSGNASVFDGLTDFGSPVDVEIIHSRAVVLQPQIVRGGTKINSGAWVCTSAFALIGGGMLTAGHCPNGSWSMVGSAYPLPYAAQHIGSYGDFQRHTSVDSTSNQIRISSAGALRSITSIGVAALGTVVCNYGFTRTTSSCATITDTSWCGPMATGENICRMVVTNGTFTNLGDSGGPWYIANTALGVHSGEFLTTGVAVFSRADNAQAILGVTIKLS